MGPIDFIRSRATNFSRGWQQHPWQRGFQVAAGVAGGPIGALVARGSTGLYNRAHSNDAANHGDAPTGGPFGGGRENSILPV